MLSLVPVVGFAQKSVSIDVKSNVHTISPYIYGTNESYDGATVSRWGGNRSSAYNWENNASNGGNDANFTSDNFYDYTENKTPGLPILNAVKSADSKGQYSLVSLQAAGYVAADKNGVVTEEQAAPSERWKKVSFHKNAPYSLVPDQLDDTVYIDELINYLSTKLGRAGDGGVSAYAIDNEPYLWNQTHARMHPEKTTPEELIQKTVDLSSVIRKLAPGADIYGPMFFGWSDAYRWGMEKEWDELKKLGKRDGNTTNYDWFVEYYLDTLSRVEKATGVRPVDAIAFHWYPESYGTKTHKRIVDLDNNVSAAELIADDMIEARLQAPRGLWDSRYTYYQANGKPSYVTYGGKAIIPKIKKSINNFYPGTKIAFTEFEYDAEDHWSGGLCLVDVLGVFGREDVYLACKWDVFKKFSIAAYNLYLNYDGEGSAFGKTSVYAMQSDTASLSSFASLDENENLHIIVVNKTADSVQTTFNIANGIYTDGVVYGFGKMGWTITKLGTVDKIENSAFSYDLPPYSAVHFILNAAPQSKLVKAQITDNAADELSIAFTDALTLVSAAEAAKEFVVTVEDVEYAVSNVSVEGNVATLKLEKSILATDKNILVTYKGKNVIGASNLPIALFDTVFVYNDMKEAPMYILSTQVDELGRYAVISLTKEIGTIENVAGFKFTSDGEDVVIDSVRKVAENPYDLYVYPAARILKYKENVLSNSNQTDLLAKDGSAVDNFSVTLNGGANFAPIIDSMVVADNYTIYLYFNTNLNPDTDYNAVGFNLSSEEETINYTAKYLKSYRYIVMKTETALQAGVDYTISYKDNGQVVTLHNGVLESFSELLENHLVDKGSSVVNIPAEVIQGDEYWFSLGQPVVEDCSDTSSLGNGKHLGYISSGDSYTYKINVAEDKNYTVYVRYASESNGEVNIVVDGVKYHLTLPSTKSFSKWLEAYRVIPLTAGEHDFVVEILASGYNINYFRFADEEVYPASYVTKTIVPTQGDVLRLTFNTNIDVLPSVEELTLTCNDTVTIPISSIEYNAPSLDVIKINFDTLIYKGDNISLRLNSSSMVSNDGGYVADTVIAINNKSTKVYKAPVLDAVDDLSLSEISVAPIPADRNEEILITTSKSCVNDFVLISQSGAVVQKGSFVGNTTITIEQAGTYILKVVQEGNTVVRKIIVR